MLGSARSNHFRAEHSRFSVRSSNVKFIKFSSSIILNRFSECLHCALLLCTSVLGKRTSRRSNKVGPILNFCGSTDQLGRAFQTDMEIEIRTVLYKYLFITVIVYCVHYSKNLYWVFVIRPARVRHETRPDFIGSTSNNTKTSSMV